MAKIMDYYREVTAPHLAAFEQTQKPDAIAPLIGEVVTRLGEQDARPLHGGVMQVILGELPDGPQARVLWAASIASGIELYRTPWDTLVRVRQGRLEAVDRKILRVLVTNLIETVQRKSNGTLEVFSPRDTVFDCMLSDIPGEIPLIRGVRQGCAFTSSGHLVVREGYDLTTQVWVNDPLPRVESHMSGAEAARYLLEDWAGDFPFATDADRANYLGMVLTLAAREFTGRPMLFPIVASTAGTGKTLAAETALLAAVGVQGYLLMGFGNGDPAEFRKRLTAALELAPRALLIDNPNAKIDSEDLASYATTDRYTDRVLGSSTTRTYPTEAPIIVTANNPDISNELLRRSCVINLDADTERPWARTGFRHPDLKAWTLEHRGEIAHAIATIFDSWYWADCPAWSRTPVGSFEAWSSRIGGVLESVGIVGFLGNYAKTFDEADEETLAWGTLIHRWYERFGANIVGVAEIFDLALGVDSLPLRGVTDRAQRISFGAALRKCRGRVIDGHRVDDVSTKQHGSRYRLLNAGGNQE